MSDVPLIDVLKTVKEAGQIGLSFYGKNPKTWNKPGDSPVTEADIAIDQFLQQKLMALTPDFGWLSEETPDNGSRFEKPYTWVVDPIDGTRGFLETTKNWCVCVALMDKSGALKLGIVYEPVENHMHHAQAGKGVWLNGNPVSYDERPYHHDRPLVFSGKKNTGFDIKTLEAFHGKIKRTYVHSIALRIVHTAQGKIDFFSASPHCHEWDLAAAHLIFSEAGGILNQNKDQPLIYNTPSALFGTLVGAQNKNIWQITSGFLMD